MDQAGRTHVRHPTFRAAAEPTYHVVAYDYGIKRNILRRLFMGLPRHRGPIADFRRGRAGAQARRHLSFERSGRSRAVADAGGNIRKLIGRKPIFGICLGHQIAGTGGRRQDLQTEIRTSGRESPGAQRNHPARSKSPRITTVSRWIPTRSTGATSKSPTSTLTTRPSKASGIATTLLSACNITLRPLPDRTIRIISSTISSI